MPRAFFNEEAVIGIALMLPDVLRKPVDGIGGSSEIRLEQSLAVGLIDRLDAERKPCIRLLGKLCAELFDFRFQRVNFLGVIDNRDILRLTFQFLDLCFKRLDFLRAAVRSSISSPI